MQAAVLPLQLPVGLAASSQESMPSSGRRDHTHAEAPSMDHPQQPPAESENEKIYIHVSSAAVDCQKDEGVSGGPAHLFSSKWKQGSCRPCQAAIASLSAFSWLPSPPSAL